MRNSLISIFPNPVDLFLKNLLALEVMVVQIQIDYISPAFPK